MPISKDKVRISITLKKESYDVIKEISKLNGFTISLIVERMLQAFIDECVKVSEENKKEDKVH